MPFFRPERALSHLLRHHDHFSPLLLSRSPSPLSRLFDATSHHSPFAAPFFTVFDDARSRTPQHLREQQQHHKDGQRDSSSELQSSSASSQSQESGVAHNDRADEWLERKRRHHRGHRHQHPLSLWSPFTSSPFNSLFNSAFANPFAPFAPLRGSGPSMSMPDMTVDVFSSATTYTVHAAVPGLDKKDIKITVDDGVLTIEAERREEKREAAKPTQSNTAAATNTSDAATSTSTSTPSASAEPTAAAKASEQSATSASSTAQSDSATTPAAAQSSTSTEVSAEEGDSDVNFHHVESFYGRVSRSVQLPEDARADELTARYENGVVKIDIPRMQEQKRQARRIDIQ